MMNHQNKTLKWSFFYKNYLRVAVGVSAGVAVEKEEQLTLTPHSHAPIPKRLQIVITDNFRRVMNGTLR